MRRLNDKVVVVTGGGGGIGGAACRRFSEEGAKVAVFDVDVVAGAAVARAIVQNGGTAGAFTCDIAKHADCRKAVRDTEAALGAIDVLVNNAGWDVFRPFVETSPADCGNRDGLSARCTCLPATQKAPFFRFPVLQHPPQLLSYLAERNIGVFLDRH